MTKQWKDLTRQDFVKLAKQMSATEMAKQYGVTVGAAYYRLKMFGLGGKPRKSRRFDPPVEELQRLYQTMSMADIAKHYGVGETVVFTRLKQSGIAPISRSQRLSGKPKSLEHRLAMSRSARESGIRRGELNGNWKGGVSSDNLRGRSRAAYFDWKSAVLANAQWRCEGCGKEHGHVCECCGHRILLHAHHIVPFAVDPERRYDPSNGKALCERCHWLEHHKQSGELLETP